ncbi:type II toxin-antitoxin system RelE/ParE family toxin [Erwiniaceae bacterium BAC15a-03b]|uniref:Toxin n=1 Tax=Winslowiella arboricola TaxID=2978220 RepID=A0A9J6PHA9_9GAMM|nr:type II toxin-antitoxin system RelE/ParE family toxin [Winslowiella arboricola]MCU5773795.1 type II toxin-antitoxin system RelE/ParE family toxin [Winslowiella arboricola]MCU5777705.1 type II toxin-antitoxin system RelE/ParE family toxin [Winslowiella arboricola]
MMVKSKKIKLTPKAEQDLADIWYYGMSHFGDEAAERYLDKIDHAFRAIAQHEIGTARPELATGVFSYPLAKHMLFFFNESDAVIIIRILHQTQDALRHLKWF